MHCRNLGCNVVGCELCKNNPNRRCQTHFREKYVDNANRVLLARCTAPIMVRVVDTVTGEEFIDPSVDEPHRLEGAQLQVIHSTAAKLGPTAVYSQQSQANQ